VERVASYLQEIYGIRHGVEERANKSGRIVDDPDRPQQFGHSVGI